MNIKASILYLLAKHKDEYEEVAYKFYISKTQKLLCESLGIKNLPEYSDLINKKETKKDDRTSDEIINDTINLFLGVKS